MKFLVSFPHTTYGFLFYRFKKLLKGVVDGSDDIYNGDPGGKIELFEQDEKGKISKVSSIQTTKPYGIQYVPEEGLYFIMGYQCREDGEKSTERILRLNDSGEIDLEIRCRLFSNLRSLHRTENGLMVTSTGIDAILEVDFNGDILWEWWASDNPRYNKMPNGKIRNIDREIDHTTRCYPTQSQTAHINSAIVDSYDPSNILASLFHQNEIIRINRENKDTEVVLDDLKRPHHLKKHERGYMFANTRDNSILICDRDFNIIEVIYAGAKASYPRRWIQDAIVSYTGTYLVGDVMNFRISEIAENGIITHYYVMPPNRIFQIEKVPDDFKLDSQVIKD